MNRSQVPDFSSVCFVYFFSVRIIPVFWLCCRDISTPLFPVTSPWRAGVWPSVPFGLRLAVFSKGVSPPRSNGFLFRSRSFGISDEVIVLFPVLFFVRSLETFPRAVPTTLIAFWPPVVALLRQRDPDFALILPLDRGHLSCLPS